MPVGCVGSCMGAILLTLVGVLFLYAAGAEGDGQSGMIVFITIPLGAAIGAGIADRWRNREK